MTLDHISDKIGLLTSIEETIDHVLEEQVFLITVSLLVASLVIAGCSSSTSAYYDLAPRDILPDEVKSTPDVVITAYQFAAQNPDILTQRPCYCGCGGMGHTSNYSCYVAGQSADVSLEYDYHALGCSICVDITADAMRMLDDGSSMDEIRSFVDRTYSGFGPSNLPEAFD